MSRTFHAAYVCCLLVALLLALFPASPPRAAAQSWRWPTSSAQVDETLRVAVLYRDDRTAAAGFVDLLNARGFDAQAVQITNSSVGTTIFLPIIRAANSANATTQQTRDRRPETEDTNSHPQLSQDALDLTDFDLLLVRAGPVVMRCASTSAI
jgi:hypothetical protein